MAKHTLSHPADTRLMGIVHGALQRDLERAREVVATRPYPVGRQRKALGEHVGWLMEFLHAHHTSEDEGLWPAVRARNPEAGALLDSLEADHRLIEPAAVALRTAAQSYASSDGETQRVALLEALEELATVLFGHLDREVAEAMPVVASTLTQGEWHAIDQEHNIKSKSLRQLGFEGHWLLDGIDAEGYTVVTQVVPPLPRFILLHGFARSYRRRMTAVWQPDRASADATPR